MSSVVSSRTNTPRFSSCTASRSWASSWNDSRSVLRETPSAELITGSDSRSPGAKTPSVMYWRRIVATRSAVPLRSSRCRSLASPEGSTDTALPDAEFEVEAVAVARHRARGLRAVDRQHDAVDEPRLVAGQEHDGLRDFPRLADARRGSARDELVLLGLELLGRVERAAQHVGVDRAGVHRVRADALVRVGDGDRLRQPDQRVLGGVIHRVAGPAHHAAVRR